MTELDPSPHLSPLAQSVTRDGKSVRIDIYGNGKGGWILEVVDEYGNSTVWDDSFATDREALDEALNTINEDGIISLIGSPRFGQKTIELNQSLSEAELNELDDFLANESIEETSMDISTLEGFLTALAIGPRPVMPSEWIPWIFDMHEGKASPEFESTDEANRVLNLVMRHYNAVIRQFMADPAGFEPIYLFGDEWGAAEWCEGFLLGMQFAQAAWSLLMVGQPRWFTPFMRLGTNEGIELIKQEHDGERWMSEVVPSLVNIHAFWHERRPSQPEAVTPGGFPPGGGPRHPVVRDAPKVGRNDPCPCGSGKKYKKCCGADGPTLH